MATIAKHPMAIAAAGRESWWRMRSSSGTGVGTVHNQPTGALDGALGALRAVFEDRSTNGS